MTQGVAKSNDFMLGTATIMLGAQEDMFNLTEENSIGLVKNVEFKSTPTFVDLTQGVTNSLVYSVMNGNTTGITSEMYEYTPQNLAYGLSLDGSKIVRQTASSTLALAVADPTAGAQTDEEFQLVAVTGFTAGDMVLVHSGKADNVMARRILEVDAAAKTVMLDSGLPFGLKVGAKFEKVNVLATGSTKTPEFLSAKIVGELANGKIVVMLFPKVRVSSGLTMGFKTDNFGNVPFELKVFDLVNTDPHFAEFSVAGPDGSSANGMLLD